MLNFGTRLTLLDFRLKLVAALLESSALLAYRRRGLPEALIVQLACSEGIFLAIYQQPRLKKDHSVDVLCALRKETEKIRNINVKPVLYPCVLYHASRITIRKVTSHNEQI